MANCHAQPLVASCRRGGGELNSVIHAKPRRCRSCRMYLRHSRMPRHSQPQQNVSQLPATYNAAWCIDCSRQRLTLMPQAVTITHPTYPTTLPLRKGHHHHSPNIPTALPTASSAGTAVGPQNPKTLKPKPRDVLDTDPPTDTGGANRPR
jgi:hypothetical protein